MLELTPLQFKFLYDRIVEKFKANHKDSVLPPEDVKSWWFGYNDYDPYVSPTYLSICWDMKETEKIDKYLEEHKELTHKSKKPKINGRRLEQQLEQALNGNKVKLGTIYKKIYFIYCGYKNLEELINAIEDFEKKNIVYSELNNCTYYLGFYFSIKSFEIKNFIVEISNEKNDIGSFNSREWGFHNLKEKPVEDDEQYVGDAQYNNGYLYLHLVGKEQRQLNIIGFVGRNEDDAKNRKMIRASIQGISHNNYLLCAECVLIKIKSNKIDDLNSHQRNPVAAGILSQTDYSTITFYLVFHRNIFRISIDLYDDFKKLEAKGNQVRRFKVIEGVYRIWNFGLEDFKIIQTKFVINSDGTAFLLPPIDVDKGTPLERDVREDFKKQPTILNISSIHQGQEKVIAVTFGEKLNMLNLAMFDFRSAASGKVTEGAFSSIGYYDYDLVENSIVASYFVLVKEKNEFIPQEISLDKAISLADENEEIKQLLNKLLSVVFLEKNWKFKEISHKREQMKKIKKLLSTLS